MHTKNILKNQKADKIKKIHMKSILSQVKKKNIIQELENQQRYDNCQEFGYRNDNNIYINDIRNSKRCSNNLMLRSNIRTQRNTHTNQQATPMTLGANSVQNKNNIERNQRDVVNDCRDRTGGDRVDISIWGNSNQNVLLTDAGVDGNGSDSDKLKFQVTYNFSKKNNKTKDSHNHQQKMLRNTYSHINRNIPTNESIIKQPKQPKQKQLNNLKDPSMGIVELGQSIILTKKSSNNSNSTKNNCKYKNIVFDIPDHAYDYDAQISDNSQKDKSSQVIIRKINKNKTLPNTSNNQQKHNFQSCPTTQQNNPLKTTTQIIQKKKSSHNATSATHPQTGGGSNRVKRSSSKIKQQLEQIIRYAQMYPVSKRSQKIIEMRASRGFRFEECVSNGGGCEGNTGNDISSSINIIVDDDQEDNGPKTQVMRTQSNQPPKNIKIDRNPNAKKTTLLKSKFSLYRYNDNEGSSVTGSITDNFSGNEGCQKFHTEEEGLQSMSKQTMSKQSCNLLQLSKSQSKNIKQQLKNISITTRQSPATNPNLSLNFLDTNSQNLLKQYSQQSQLTKHKNTTNLLQKTKRLLQNNKIPFNYSFTHFIENQINQLSVKKGRKTVYPICEPGNCNNSNNNDYNYCNKSYNYFQSGSRDGVGVSIGATAGNVNKVSSFEVQSFEQSNNSKDLKDTNFHTKNNIISKKPQKTEPTDIRQQPITKIHQFFKGQSSQSKQFSNSLTIKQLKNFRNKYQLYDIIYKRTKQQLNIKNRKPKQKKIDFNHIKELSVKNAVFLNQVFLQCNTRERRKEVEKVMSQLNFYN